MNWIWYAICIVDNTTYYLDYTVFTTFQGVYLWQNVCKIYGMSTILVINTYLHVFQRPYISYYQRIHMWYWKYSMSTIYSWRIFIIHFKLYLIKNGQNMKIMIYIWLCNSSPSHQFKRYHVHSWNQLSTHEWRYHMTIFREKIIVVKDL